MELKFKHFVALQALDVLTTYIGLEYLGLVERNPFANSIFQEYGLILALVGMKIIGLMVIYGILSIYSLQIKKIALNIICIIFIGVVMNNAYQMLVV